MEIPELTLRDGHKIPMLAFGTGTAWFKELGNVEHNQELVDLVKAALARGFRHLDCAEMYGTEVEVGQAIRESGIPRERLFITNKVAQGIDDIPAALEQSLGKMQLEYFDLYLIHIPFFAKSDSDFQRAWKTMEQLKQTGKIRSIGVSNYLRPHVEATLATATDPPVINQIEYHPYLQRAGDYVSWLRSQDVQLGSFKGLTPAFRGPGDGPLRAPLKRIAAAHGDGVSEAAILIAWLLRRGVVAVTTTTKVDRLEEYASALGVTLSDAEVEEITTVGASYHFRTSWPEHFDADDRS